MGYHLRPDSVYFVNLDECKSPRLSTGVVITKLLCCIELDRADDSLDIIDQLGLESIWIGLMTVYLIYFDIYHGAKDSAPFGTSRVLKHSPKSIYYQPSNARRHFLYSSELVVIKKIQIYKFTINRLTFQ